MESNPFPQQTGITGLVRHFLLLSTRVIDEKDKWDDLIGKKSFDGTTEQTFGKIKKIYPLFIFSDLKKVMLPVKELDKLFFINKNGVKVSYNNTGEAEMYCVSSVKDSFRQGDQLNLKESYFDDAFVEDNYSEPIQMYCKTEKDFSPPGFYGIKTKHLHKDKGIFIKHLQPGILKSYKAETKGEKAYYKMRYLKMNKGFHFSFLADIDEKIATDKPLFMSFGGENSPFKVTIRDEDIPNISAYENKNVTGNIFHFISDTIIEKSAFENVLQFIGETQFYRSMKTDAKNNRSDIYNLNRDLSNFKNIFSGSKLLIKKGSIAFVKPDKIDNFKNAIENIQFVPYNKIGYNYFKQINNL
jgi:CRISPR type III-B/RAMP module-associated protein Cmr3